MFNYYDINTDQLLSEAELIDIEHRDHLEKLSQNCHLVDLLTFDDSDRDLRISMEEFYHALRKWFDILKHLNRGKKITCPGARDKLNFRQDKHIFSPNVLRTSKKFTDSLFFLDKDKLFGNRTSKILMYLPGGQVKIFRFFYPCLNRDAS